MAVLASLNVLVNADARGFNRDLDRARRSTGRFQRSITSGFRRVVIEAAAVTTAVLSIRTAFNQVNQAVTQFATFEDLRSTLNAVTGSAEAGADAFEFISDFASKTQFSIEQLTRTYATLRAAGIQPTTDLLTAFADAAAISTDQTVALQAITDLFARTTAGGLGLEDLNRLADQSIPVWRIFEERLGLTRLEIAEFGRTAEGTQILLDALISGIEEDFGGAAISRLRNVNTSFSNLRDAISRARDIFVQEFAPQLVSIINDQIIPAIEDNEEAFRDLGQAFGSFLADFAENLPVVIDAAETLATTIRDLSPLIREVISGFTNLAGATILVLTLKSLVVAVSSVAAAFTAFAIGPVVTVIAAIGALILVVIDLRNILNILWGVIRIGAGVVGGLVSVLALPVAIITDLTGVTDGLTESIIEFIEAGFGIPAAFSDIQDAIAGFGESAVDIFNDIRDSIRSIREETEELNTVFQTELQIPDRIPGPNVVPDPTQFVGPLQPPPPGFVGPLSRDEILNAIGLEDLEEIADGLSRVRNAGIGEPQDPMPFVGPSIDPELLEIQQEEYQELLAARRAMEDFISDVGDTFRFGLRNILNEGNFEDFPELLIDSFRRALNDRLSRQISELFEGFLEGILTQGLSGGGARELGEQAGTFIRGLLGFQDGGFIPGPEGSPQLVVAHGGELVLNRAQQRSLAEATSGGDTFNFSFGDNTPPDIVQQIQNNRPAAIAMGQELRLARVIR